ncbi:DUF3996 domain-containing protein [Borrelia sp. A-FGy1]|uniref:BAPKO_0422 family outer member beta-barrel protein n=1 Tax=Borrelia sp. A-FGy1 TaxID=2608247 RepID=UPI0015F54045|nr:DUF3996 domain-containing protein [Borrelia sp. A-FGy1]QMU99329.1 DUF3996 domain-containing protein [Borrelia sp. A-FGy1]
MKKMTLILILSLIIFNAFAEDLYTNRRSFSFGIIGPFPSSIQLNLGPNIELEVGLYNGLRNLFQNIDTIFSSLEFITPTYNLLEESKIIDFALGIGIYGLWWISEWKNTQTVYNSINIGGRLSFILNFSISQRLFDIFLKAGPGINLWGKGGNLIQKWEIFATLGLRFWII